MQIQSRRLSVVCGLMVSVDVGQLHYLLMRVKRDR